MDFNALSSHNSITLWVFLIHLFSRFLFILSSWFYAAYTRLSNDNVHEFKIWNQELTSPARIVTLCESFQIVLVTVIV